MAGLNSRSMGRSSFLFLVVKKGRKFSHLEILQLFASLLFTVGTVTFFIQTFFIRDKVYT